MRRQLEQHDPLSCCRAADLLGADTGHLEHAVAVGLGGAAEPGDDLLQRREIGRAYADEILGRGRDELLHAPVGDQSTLSDHDQMIGRHRHLAHQVRGDEHRTTLGGETAQQPANPLDALGVEAVDRLVQHHRLRVAQQCRRDPQPLAHAERELPGALARDVVQPDEVDQLLDATARDAVGLRERAQVVPCRSARVDRPRLEQRAYLVQRRRCRAYGLPFTITLPAVGRSRPSTSRIVVDLPAPFGPRKPVTIPGRTSKESSRPPACRRSPSSTRAPRSPRQVTTRILTVV